MNFDKKNILQFIILMVLIIGYQFYNIIEHYTFITFFFEKCVSIAWFIVGIYFLCDRDTAVSRVFLIASFNNVLDEFIFNPLVFGINERVLGIVLIFYLYNKYLNNARKI